MIFQLIAAGSGYGVQLMVLQLREGLPRSTKRIIELIIGIVHLIDTKDCF